MGLVVRCTSCRETSIIEPSARGRTVECPHCQSLFVALPEVELVETSNSKRTPTVASRPTKRRKSDPVDGPASSELSADADHDPHRNPPSPLPPSVLIGLALLPFTIPIFWMLIPEVIGPAPLLSIAVPLAVAVSTSILCMAIIYTIDWSPAIRIKGVLILLILASFVSVCLYCVTPHTVEMFKRMLGHSDWQVFHSPNEPSYTISLPGHPQRDSRIQPIRGVTLDCFSVPHAFPNEKDAGDYVFIVGSGQLQTKKGGNGPAPGSAAWFEQVVDGIVKEAQGQLDPQSVKTVSVDVKTQDHAIGRQFTISLDNFNSNRSRVVRVFEWKGNVYYQSVEGNDLPPEDDGIWTFFREFTPHGKSHDRR